MELFKKKTDEQIKKEMERKRDEILRRADVLRRFVLKDGTGWAEFRKLIVEYQDACKKRKAVTAIDRLVAGNIADDKVLQELKLIDHEIYTLGWVLNMPFDLIAQADEIIKKGNE